MDPAIRKMIRGFRRFRKEYFSDETKLYSQLRHGQMPSTLVIACCDSRVDPALITQSAPGDIFVIRNVANLVPPYHPDSSYHGVSSAIEYAVCSLNVKHIVVLGHSNCGGIRALMSEDWERKPSEFLHQWLCLAESARETVLRELAEEPHSVKLHACEESSILLSMENLTTFPWIRERVDAGNLYIHGWYFNMEDGEMYSYDSEQCRFTVLDRRAEAE